MNYALIFAFFFFYLKKVPKNLRIPKICCTFARNIETPSLARFDENNFANNISALNNTSNFELKSL